MLEKLFIANYFNYKSFIYENSLALGLSPNDSLILIYLLEEYQKGNKKIDVSKIEEKFLLHKKDINNSLSNLLENAFYNVVLVDKDGVLEEQITISPFFKKIEDYLNDNNKEDTNKKIFTLIERKSKKLLTANDYDNINNLIVVDNYNYDDFNNTINYLEKAKLDVTVRNIMKYIEKKTTISKAEETEKNIVSGAWRGAYDSDVHSGALLESDAESAEGTVYRCKRSL